MHKTVNDVAAYFWHHRHNYKRFALEATETEPYLGTLLPSLPEQLEFLQLSNAPNLKYLGKLQLPDSLNDVKVNNCGLLNTLDLPDGVEALFLGSVPLLVLKRLPKQLKSLTLSHITNLVEFLPELPEGLERLTLENCSNRLPHLPDSLKTLSIKGSDIATLPKTLPGTLEELTIDNCPKLRLLPDMPASLKRVTVNRNKAAGFRVGNAYVRFDAESRW